MSDYYNEDAVAEAAPWKKSMNRIIIGLVLSTMILEIWCLNYIFPAIGTMLLLLGFRGLRHENKWFRNGFFVTVVQGAYVFLELILNTTIIQSVILTSPVTKGLTIANLLLLLVKLVCLWSGMIAAQQKVGIPPQAGGVIALVIWYMLMYGLVIVSYDGLVIGGGMIIGYILIIRNIYKRAKELEETGYVIQTASVKVTDRNIVSALGLVFVIGCACGYLFGGSYPMSWNVVDESEHDEVEGIKNHLIKLGFPEYVLNDLSIEDIAACDGALQVVMDVTDEKLRITGVGVQIPGERKRWIVFHHFLWTSNPGFYGTEAIQLWPAYRDDSSGWGSDGEVTGRVLYNQDEKSFAAPYASLGNQTVTSNSIFWGNQTHADVFATFSMPQKGEKHRGYVAYPIVEIREDHAISSWMNYTHQRSWIQYPAKTAIEHQMTNGRGDAGAFLTIQDASQFYPIN